MIKRMPWMKFYPADWRSDPRLRMCSLAARGFWIELLSYMHEADPYGHLVIAGTAPTENEIAKLLSIRVPIVNRLCAELERLSVFSRTENGIIYSRRMVRDYEKSQQDQANGRRGGNPKIVKGVNPGDNGEDKAQMLEARSQSLEREVSITAGASLKQYAFEGRSIRLTQGDIDQWAKSYPSIPSIVAELQAADDYYTAFKPKDGKIYHRISNWLKRREIECQGSASERKRERAREMGHSF